MALNLQGMAWDHPRGCSPMVATAREYGELHRETLITWDKRSLQDFEDFPIGQLADEYDLIVIDHPHIGDVVKEGHLVALDELAPEGALEVVATQSLGDSYESYEYAGHLWALPVDAASQVAAYRPDLLSSVPTRWSEVVDLARAGKVLWPLAPVHALMSFFTLAANRGTPCAEGRSRLIEWEDGRAVLETMRSVSRSNPPEALGLDPIEALDRMSSDGSQHAYCPLIFGYANYAREGFRDHLVKFANIPSLDDGGPRGSTLGGAGIAVSAKSERVEEAVNYALWVTGSECQKGVYFESGGQPANAEAWSDARVNAATHDFFRDTRDTLLQAWMRPRYPGYLRFQKEGGAIVNSFLADRADADETLARLEKAYQESFQ